MLAGRKVNPEGTHDNSDSRSLPITRIGSKKVYGLSQLFSSSQVLP